MDLYKRSLKPKEAIRNDSRQESLERALSGALSALRDDVQSPANYVRLSRACYELDRADEALAALERGLDLCPPSLRLYREYIVALRMLNRTPDAINVAQRALKQFPDDLLLKLSEALSLPILYSDVREVEFYRQRFGEGLVRLSSELRLQTAEDRENALFALGRHENFLLGYQNDNDRELQMLYGDFAHRIMAASYPQWAERLRMPDAGSDKRLRIGYISYSFRYHTVSKWYLGWMSERDRERFSVFSYYIGRECDWMTEEAKRSSDNFRHISGDLESICRAILGDRLHVATFLDVGMAPEMTQLAALRLAPIQCVALGHPITSGLPTVDYFLSSDLMEPDNAENAQSQYSETLVRLPGTSVCFSKPVIPELLFCRRRSDFGLRDDAVVYLCCQNSFKYLPQHDDVFPSIARLVPHAQFVFVQWNESIGKLFRDRLDRVFSAAQLNSSDYCVFVPKLDNIIYWNLNCLGDVYLDTLGWSGGNSAFEAVACRRPIVTLPGPLMRSRQSYGILHQLGVTETIAKNKEEYISIAAKLGLDAAWRRAVIEKMVAGFPQLYSDTRCVRALEKFYERVTSERLLAESDRSV